MLIMFVIFDLDLNIQQTRRHTDTQTYRKTGKQTESHRGTQKRPLSRLKTIAHVKH